MKHQQSLRRRSFAITASTLALAGVAGCLNGDDGDDGDGGDSDADGDSDGDGGNGDAEGQVDSYLSDNNATGYESVEDMTGEDEVTVTVGAGDGGTAFDPAGISIDSGTTVVWEWSGEGGAHNVVPEDDSDIDGFGEEEQTDEAGYTVEHTFEESGAALYVCEPHAAQGMYGGIAVQ